MRMQEVFGLAATPRIGGGAVPVTFKLLSPGTRPLQITRDLASFWRNAYVEVRKDMRGRYPRHYWPENPLEAEPTRRAKPRGPDTPSYDIAPQRQEPRGRRRWRLSSHTRLRDRLPPRRGARQHFRWRGNEVSRVEGFTDAVFAFAVTLLVVALEVPQTFEG